MSKEINDFIWAGRKTQVHPGRGSSPPFFYRHFRGDKVLKEISGFIRSHYEDFLAFDDVKIYYDNGQVEVSKILSSVFNALLPNPIFRKVMPSEYKLFQAADLLCTLELVKLKLENNMFSKSEMTFFGNVRDLKKNYLKPLDKKKWS